MSTKLLSDGSGKLRIASDDENLLWHGDTPAADPLDPSGWHTIPDDLNINYSGYQASAGETDITVEDGGYLALPTPPYTSLDGLISLSQQVDCSGFTSDRAAKTINFSYIKWGYYTGIVSSYTIPYGGVGVPLSSTLRATGLFRISKAKENWIALGDSYNGTRRTWDATLNVLGHRFLDTSYQITSSYPSYKTWTFFDSGLAAHINQCLDNNAVTAYSTQKPYLSGAGVHSLDIADDWRNAYWDEQIEGETVRYDFYYPFSSSNQGSNCSGGGFTIQGYFVTP